MDEADEEREEAITEGEEATGDIDPAHGGDMPDGEVIEDEPMVPEEEEVDHTEEDAEANAILHDERAEEEGSGPAHTAEHVPHGASSNSNSVSLSTLLPLDYLIRSTFPTDEASVHFWTAFAHPDTNIFGMLVLHYHAALKHYNDLVIEGVNPDLARQRSFSFPPVGTSREMLLLGGMDSAQQFVDWEETAAVVQQLRDRIRRLRRRNGGRSASNLIVNGELVVEPTEAAGSSSHDSIADHISSVTPQGASIPSGHEFDASLWTSVRDDEAVAGLFNELVAQIGEDQAMAVIRAIEKHKHGLFAQGLREVDPDGQAREHISGVAHGSPSSSFFFFEF